MPGCANALKEKREIQSANVHCPTNTSRFSSTQSNSGPKSSSPSRHKYTRRDNEGTLGSEGKTLALSSQGRQHLGESIDLSLVHLLRTAATTAVLSIVLRPDGGICEVRGAGHGILAEMVCREPGAR